MKKEHELDTCNSTRIYSGWLPLPHTVRIPLTKWNSFKSSSLVQISKVCLLLNGFRPIFIMLLLHRIHHSMSELWLSLVFHMLWKIISRSKDHISFPHNEQQQQQQHFWKLIIFKAYLVTKKRKDINSSWAKFPI